MALSLFKKRANGLVCAITFAFLISFTLGTGPFGSAPVFSAETHGQVQGAGVPPPDKIVFPDDVAAIEERYKGADRGKLVICLQDAHCIFEAQENIAEVIGLAEKRYGLKLVGVEGAEGDIETDFYRSFPDKEIKVQTIDKFVSLGEISGAEKAAILNEKESDFFGIEDMDLYYQNKNAFLGTLRNEALVSGYLKKLELRLNKISLQIAPAGLRKLYRKINAFEADQSDLLDHLEYLRKEKGNTEGYEMIKKLFAAQERERELDVGKIDREISRLERDVERMEKMSGDGPGLDKFREKISEYRLGNIEKEHYARFLVKKARGTGTLRESEIPNLLDYVGHAEEMGRIKSDALFGEIDKLSEEVRSAYLVGGDLKMLDRLFRHLRILKKLSKLELFREDLVYYQENRPEFAQKYFYDFFEEKLGTRDGEDPVYDGIFKPHRTFYRSAVLRDEAMFRNLTERLARENRKMALINAGGFHTEGLKRLLKDAGYSYVVVAPRITDFSGENRYEEIMLGNNSFERHARETLSPEKFISEYEDSAAEVIGEEFVRRITDNADVIKRGWLKNIRERGLSEAKVAEYTARIENIFSRLDAVSPEKMSERLNAVLSELRRFQEVKTADISEQTERLQSELARVGASRLTLENILDAFENIFPGGEKVKKRVLSAAEAKEAEGSSLGKVAEMARKRLEAENFRGLTIAEMEKKIGAYREEKNRLEPRVFAGTAALERGGLDLGVGNFAKAEIITKKNDEGEYYASIKTTPLALTPEGEFTAPVNEEAWNQRIAASRVANLDNENALRGGRPRLFADFEISEDGLTVFSSPVYEFNLKMREAVRNQDTEEIRQMLLDLARLMQELIARGWFFVDFKMDNFGYNEKGELVIFDLDSLVKIEDISADYPIPEDLQADVNRNMRLSEPQDPNSVQTPSSRSYFLTPFLSQNFLMLVEAVRKASSDQLDFKDKWENIVIPAAAEFFDRITELPLFRGLAEAPADRVLDKAGKERFLEALRVLARSRITEMFPALGAGGDGIDVDQLFAAADAFQDYGVGPNLIEEDDFSKVIYDSLHRELERNLPGLLRETAEEIKRKNPEGFRPDRMSSLADSFSPWALYTKKLEEIVNKMRRQESIRENKTFRPVSLSTSATAAVFLDLAVQEKVIEDAQEILARKRRDRNRFAVDGRTEEEVSDIKSAVLSMLDPVDDINNSILRADQEIPDSFSQRLFDSKDEIRRQLREGDYRGAAESIRAAAVYFRQEAAQAAQRNDAASERAAKLLANRARQALNVLRAFTRFGLSSGEALELARKVWQAQRTMIEFEEITDTSEAEDKKDDIRSSYKSALDILKDAAGKYHGRELADPAERFYRDNIQSFGRQLSVTAKNAVRGAEERIRVMEGRSLGVAGGESFRLDESEISEAVGDLAARGVISEGGRFAENLAERIGELAALSPGLSADGALDFIERSAFHELAARAADVKIAELTDFESPLYGFSDADLAVLMSEYLKKNAGRITEIIEGLNSFLAGAVAENFRKAENVAREVARLKEISASTIKDNLDTAGIQLSAKEMAELSGQLNTALQGTVTRAERVENRAARIRDDLEALSAETGRSVENLEGAIFDHVLGTVKSGDARVGVVTFDALRKDPRTVKMLAGLVNEGGTLVIAYPVGVRSEIDELTQGLDPELKFRIRMKPYVGKTPDFYEIGREFRGHKVRGIEEKAMFYPGKVEETDEQRMKAKDVVIVPGLEGVDSLPWSAAMIPYVLAFADVQQRNEIMSRYEGLIEYKETKRGNIKIEISDLRALLGRVVKEMRAQEKIKAAA